MKLALLRPNLGFLKKIPLLQVVGMRRKKNIFIQKAFDQLLLVNHACTNRKVMYLIVLRDVHLVLEIFYLIEYNETSKCTEQVTEVV